MIEIRMTGRLAKDFMPRVKMEVTSIPEAIRGLCVQLPGFEHALKEGHYRVTRVSAGGVKTDVDEGSLHLSLGRTRVVYIRPVVKGNKRGGLGKIIAGVVLLGAAFLIGPAAFTSSFTGGAAMTGTQGYLASMGGMMVLNGVSAMLSPQPKERKEQNSHVMDASGNRTEQGGGVPIIYGEVFCGSTVISSGMSVEEYPITGTPDEENMPPEFNL
jgi:predicted phage tail protein